MFVVEADATVSDTMQGMSAADGIIATIAADVKLILDPVEDAISVPRETVVSPVVWTLSGPNISQAVPSRPRYVPGLLFGIEAPAGVRYPDAAVPTTMFPVPGVPETANFTRS
jgi:hypothetical protein